MTFDAFARGKRETTDTGPGMYNIPSTIGAGPKFSIRGRSTELKPQYAPKYYLLPSTLNKNGINIGHELKFKKDFRQTAVSEPNLYAIPSTIGQGPKVSIRPKMSSKTEITPGPGQYDPKINDKGPAFVVGVGRRFDFIQDNILVPPGSYDIPSTMQPRAVINHADHGPTRRPKFQKKQHPGPIYDVVQPFGHDARKCQFPKNKTEKSIPKTPGPGEYEVLKPFGESSKRIYTTMHVRTKERSRYVIDVPYYDIPSTIDNKKKIHMLSRPPTSYETPSPGPVYDIPTSIVPRPMTIGVKTEKKNPMSDIPGPDAYFSSDAPKDISEDVVCPLDGPYARDIINYKEVSSLPGPGQYDVDAGEKNKKKGFTISNRDLSPSRPDTSAPYRLLSSTLGGPSYTISLKDY